MSNLFQRLSYFTTFFTLVVIVLGAFVRLSDAGLGCPDWPGCYGQIVVPSSDAAIAEAKNNYPERLLEHGKAWKEMAHRYFAGALGLFILALAMVAWLNRRDQEQQLFLPIFLVCLVIFQAALGMWTVTLLLKPVIVTLHLLAGMATLGLLWLMTLKAGRKNLVSTEVAPCSLKIWAFIALLVLIGQIALGGWTSTNYVAFHCPDLPMCQGRWLPELDIDEAFTIWRPSGVDYEGGTLSLNAGVTVHFMHRLGAVIALLVIGLLALRCIFGRYAAVRLLGSTVLLLLIIQISLGIANVMLRLPMPVAVSHNAVAALLLMSLLALNFRLSRTG